MAKRFDAKIYCGPSLPQGKLSRFRIFKGDVPVYIKAIIDECPQVGGLIVPVDQLTKTRAAIEKKGTREHELFVQIAKRFKQL